METPRFGSSVPPRLRLGIAAVILVGVGFGVFTFFGGRPGPSDKVAAQDSVQTQDSSQKRLGTPVANIPTTPTTVSASTDTPPKMSQDSAAKSAGPRDSTGAKVHYNSGESPEFAASMGWPVKTPPIKPGSLLPSHRIVAYYGNPLSKKMGVLGEYDTETMLKKLDGEVAKWQKADPSTPVIPALQLIVTVAQGDPGTSGKYRLRHSDALVEQVAKWADSRHALLILDVQVGTSTVQEELPRLIPFLQRPNVHLAIDPEFSMKDGSKPGTKIGIMNSSDINFAIKMLDDVVKKNNLPPKILVVHRFTRRMVTDAENIHPTSNVQVVMNMDGWGAPWLKRDSYRDYIVRHPVEYTGFKLFYHNDTKKGNPLLTPEEVLKLRPKPLYIQYQ